MPTYEIGIYNEEVRELTRVGDHHKNLSDSWDSIHYIEIFARDESQARQKALAKYPREHGYVIEQITRMEDS